MPIALFPGITPEIRTVEARLSDTSSERFIIAETFVPISGAISYLVTAGPREIPTTRV